MWARVSSADTLFRNYLARARKIIVDMDARECVSLSVAGDGVRDNTWFVRLPSSCVAVFFTSQMPVG